MDIFQPLSIEYKSYNYLYIYFYRLLLLFMCSSHLFSHGFLKYHCNYPMSFCLYNPMIYISGRSSYQNHIKHHLYPCIIYLINKGGPIIPYNPTSVPTVFKLTYNLIGYIWWGKHEWQLSTWKSTRTTDKSIQK